MADEKIDVQELLGLTSEQLDDQVEQERRLTELVARVGEADPRTLTLVARMGAKQGADLVFNLEASDDQLRGALSTVCYFVTLLAKRVDLDNPSQLIVDPKDIH